jgi:hypothetical protein
VDCDDADQCTQDVCNPSGECSSNRIGFAAVGQAFQGGLAIRTCSEQRVPPAIGKLFAKADRLCQRAAASTKAKKTKRLVKKAVRALNKAGKFAAKAGRKRVLSSCANDLGALIGEAQARAACLLGTL